MPTNMMNVVICEVTAKVSIIEIDGLVSSIVHISPRNLIEVLMCNILDREEPHVLSIPTEIIEATQVIERNDTDDVEVLLAKLSFTDPSLSLWVFDSVGLIHKINTVSFVNRINMDKSELDSPIYNTVIVMDCANKQQLSFDVNPESKDVQLQVIKDISNT